MFKALSHPLRLRIFLELVSGCGPEGCCSGEAVRHSVGELGRDLALAPSTVSHHLKELRQAGLMKVERCGQKIECWTGEEALALLGGFFDETRAAASAPPTSSGGKNAKRQR